MRSLVVATIVMACLGSAGLHAADKSSVFVGEISDSICARDGSHAEAMRMSKDMGESAASCTLACVYHSGGKFVLLDRQHKQVYVLAPQDQARKYAGQAVRITGTLHRKTLEISEIAPAK